MAESRPSTHQSAHEAWASTRSSTMQTLAGSVVAIGMMAGVFGYFPRRPGGGRARRNGSDTTIVGEVSAIDPQTLKVVLDDGRTLSLDRSELFRLEQGYRNEMGMGGRCLASDGMEWPRTKFWARKDEAEHLPPRLRPRCRTSAARSARAPASKSCSRSGAARLGTRPSRRCRRTWTRILRPTTPPPGSLAAAE